MTTDLPIIESCEGCGACCMTQSSPPGYVILAVKRNDAWPSDNGDVERFKNLPTEARVILKKYIDQLLNTNPPQDEQPCCWLDQTTMRCRFHAHRPQICRDFEMGSDDCRAWRVGKLLTRIEEFEA